jgi:glutaminyl-tRNA synthetase
MPTLAGARRRGYTPEGFKLFAERIGVSKANQVIDFGVLEDCMREVLNEVAPRRMAVLDPVKLVLVNYPAGKEELVEVPNHPQNPEMGKRSVPFSGELWIEREDYQEVPAKGYFRLYPGNMVRLRYGYVVKCIGYDKASDTVRCEYLEDSRSGTAGADKYKVKGNIHWVSVQHAHAADVHLYDRLFKDSHADGMEGLNPASKRAVRAQLEPGVAGSATVQFERHGYFVADGAGFNRTVTLRDSWAAGKPG